MTGAATKNECSMATQGRQVNSEILGILDLVLLEQKGGESGWKGEIDVSGERGMTHDSFWKNHPLLMMIRANDLGKIVEHLEAQNREGVWQGGTSVAVPVLLSLATEIGLKAWYWREGVNPPPKTHDLVELFDGLGEDTRRRLEEKMPEVPGIAPELPVYPGIRKALCQNKDVFKHWRYAHEHDSLTAETGVLKSALKAIVDEFIVEMPSERRLKG